MADSGMRPLVNRVAVITGASSGIGEAIARTLAVNGASVVLAARRIEKLEDIQKQIEKDGGKVAAFKADVTEPSDMKAMVEYAEKSFGSVDILVNSAGVMYYAYMKNVNLEEWNRQVDVNCKGVMNSIAAALPSMLSRERGHIINISSDAGRKLDYDDDLMVKSIKVFPGLSVYSATKFFVEALSQGLRTETASSGLKVTTIQPGDVLTELQKLTTDSEAKEKFAETDMERMLEPNDIANAVLFAVTQPKNCAINEILVEPQQAPI